MTRLKSRLEVTILLRWFFGLNKGRVCGVELNGRPNTLRVVTSWDNTRIHLVTMLANCYLGGVQSRERERERESYLGISIT